MKRDSVIVLYIYGYMHASVSPSWQCVKFFWLLYAPFRKEGQDTQDELQKRNLREELEDRERRHFSSKDKYIGKKKEKEDEEEEYLTSLLLSCNLLF